jgi:hypothetical protein
MVGLRVTVVKPVKPLRYRLSPVEEKLDNLDKLERELELAIKAGKVPEEQQIESRMYLKVQRDKLQVVKDKALGIVPVVERELIDRTNDRIPSQLELWLSGIDPQKAFKFALFSFVLVWFFMHNKGL